MKYELYPEEVASLASYNPDERRISIFADSEGGRSAAHAVAERVGARVLFAGTPQQGLARLANYPVGDAVFVDVAQEGCADLDLFPDRIDAIGLIDRVPVLINSAPDCLDRVAARMSAPSVALIGQASAADWVATLAMSAHCPTVGEIRCCTTRRSMTRYGCSGWPTRFSELRVRWPIWPGMKRRRCAG